MTEQQVRENTQLLIDDAAKTMKEKLERVFKSGAVNCDAYEDGFSLPRMILAALLQDCADRYENFLHNNNRVGRERKRIVKNIYIQI